MLKTQEEKQESVKTADSAVCFNDDDQHSDSPSELKDNSKTKRKDQEEFTFDRKKTGGPHKAHEDHLPPVPERKVTVTRLYTRSGKFLINLITIARLSLTHSLTHSLTD